MSLTEIKINYAQLDAAISKLAALKSELEQTKASETTSGFSSGAGFEGVKSTEHTIEESKELLSQMIEGAMTSVSSCKNAFATTEQSFISALKQKS